MLRLPTRIVLPCAAAPHRYSWHRVLMHRGSCLQRCSCRLLARSPAGARYGLTPLLEAKSNIGHLVARGRQLGGDWRPVTNPILPLSHSRFSLTVVSLPVRQGNHSSSVTLHQHHFVRGERLEPFWRCA